MKKDKMIRELEKIEKRLEKTEALFVDREHDSIDWTRTLTWLGILGGSGYLWYSIFTNGFFVTMCWVVVVSAILGLCLRMSGRV